MKDTVVSHQAGFEGSVAIVGSAQRISSDGLSIVTKSFDRTQSVSAANGYPIEASFTLNDGKLASLEFVLESALQPYVY